MTIPQAVALDYPGWDGLSARAVRRADGTPAPRLRARDRMLCLDGAGRPARWCDDYGIYPAKVHAVGIGRNHAPAAPQRDWSAPRFLFVGVDWLGKNGPGVLAAFAGAARGTPDSARSTSSAPIPPLATPASPATASWTWATRPTSGASSALRNRDGVRPALPPRGGGHRLRRGDDAPGAGSSARRPAVPTT